MMELIAVIGIENMRNYTKQLPIKNILNRKYKTKHHVYKKFRECVEKGRYGLAMKNNQNKVFIFDTQLIEKTEEN